MSPESPCCIILIDDDPMANFVGNIIVRWARRKVDVHTFTDPSEFVSQVDRIGIRSDTIILLDINMPEMDGWQVLDALIRRGISCTVYILTSSLNPEDMVKATRYSMIKEFLNKPLTSDMVGRMIPTHEH